MGEQKLEYKRTGDCTNEAIAILVEDCITYGFSEKESIEYIEKRYRKIGTSTLYRYKHAIDSDEYPQKFLNEYTRIGFVKTHLKLIRSMESVYRDMFKVFGQIAAKEEKTDSEKYLMVRYAQGLAQINERISRLNLGNPIISQIKKSMELEKVGKVVSGVRNNQEGTGALSQYKFE